MRNGWAYGLLCDPCPTGELVDHLRMVDRTAIRVLLAEDLAVVLIRHRIASATCAPVRVAGTLLPGRGNFARPIGARASRPGYRFDAWRMRAIKSVCTRADLNRGRRVYAGRHATHRLIRPVGLDQRRDHMAVSPLHIQALVEATRSVCETMLRLPFSFSDPRSATGIRQHDVSGVVGLSGDITGSVTIGLDRSSAEQLASALAGVCVKSDSADFADAIGELTNMIVGAAKARFPNRSVSIGCPSVIVAPSHNISNPSTASVIAIPCVAGTATLFIEITIVSVMPNVAAASTAA